MYVAGTLFTENGESSIIFAFAQCKTAIKLHENGNCAVLLRDILCGAQLFSADNISYWVNGTVFVGLLNR